MRIDLLSVPYDSARRGERMGAGPLHLLNSGLAGQLEGEGHRVTIQPVELPGKFRAAEIAGTFELAAAIACGVVRDLDEGEAMAFQSPA